MAKHKRKSPPQELPIHRQLARTLVRRRAEHLLELEGAEADAELDVQATRLQKVFRAEASLEKSQRDSKRAKRSLNEATATLTSLLTEAVKAIGFKYPDFWRGEKFRRQAACKQLLKDGLPAEVRSIWDGRGRGVNGSLSTIMLRTKALAGWTRTDCDREKLEMITDPDRRRYLMEREKSRSKTGL